MKALVVTPTYNEKDNIQLLVKRVLACDPRIHVLVVDDNSPDGTGQLVKELQKTNDRLFLLERPGKQGIGPAYVAGFKWGLERDFDVIIEMDADLSHRPRYLMKFLSRIEYYDMIVACRWMKGGKLVNWPWQRVMLSRMANLYAQLILGTRLRDMTGGFICYRRYVLEALDLDKIHSDGYSFQIEMKYRASKLGFKFLETPIAFVDRKKGASKISRHIILEALWMVWFLKFTVPAKCGIIPELVKR